MIVKMTSGILDLNKILSVEQKSFYDANRAFTIHSLHYPNANESVLVSFDKKIYELSYFKRKLYGTYTIYFQRGFYDCILQDRVKVIILDNGDLLLSNNLDLEIAKDKNPLYEELTHFLTLGKKWFENLVLKTNLKILYQKTFNEEFYNTILDVALKYRVFTDNPLDEDFFFDVLNNFFPIRFALKCAFKEDSISTKIGVVLNATFSTYFAYDSRYQGEISKRDPKFAYSSLNKYISLNQYAIYYKIATNMMYICECKNLIDEIMFTLKKDDIFKQISFQIARKVKIYDHKSAKMIAVVSVIIMYIVLEYYKKGRGQKLADKYNFNYKRIVNNLMRILRKSGYQTTTENLFGEENTKTFQQLVKKDWNVNYDTFEVHLALIKELMEMVKKKKSGVKFEYPVVKLTNALNRTDVLNIRIAPGIPKEQRVDFIVSLINRIKSWKRLKYELGKKMCKLIGQIAERLEITIDLEFLYDHNFFRIVSKDK
ncbi:MAG: hypothetical protein ACFFAN_01455 [Promethearchaeota archaeon]